MYLDNISWNMLLNGHVFVTVTSLFPISIGARWKQLPFFETGIFDSFLLNKNSLSKYRALDFFSCVLVQPSPIFFMSTGNNLICRFLARETESFLAISFFLGINWLRTFRNGANSFVAHCTSYKNIDLLESNTFFDTYTERLSVPRIDIMELKVQILKLKVIPFNLIKKCILK